MSFIKNPFRKSAAQKVQQKPATPTPMNTHTNNQAASTASRKSSLPNNYLDPKSVF